VKEIVSDKAREDQWGIHSIDKVQNTAVWLVIAYSRPFWRVWGYFPTTTIWSFYRSIVLAPKRTILAQKHVVWAIKRENRSSGSTWVQDPEKGIERTGQESQEKSLYFAYMERCHHCTD